MAGQGDPHHYSVVGDPKEHCPPNTGVEEPVQGSTIIIIIHSVTLVQLIPTHSTTLGVAGQSLDYDYKQSVIMGNMHMEIYLPV